MLCNPIYTLASIIRHTSIFRHNNCSNDVCSDIAITSHQTSINRALLQYWYCQSVIMDIMYFCTLQTYTTFCTGMVWGVFVFQVASAVIAEIWARWEKTAWCKQLAEQATYLPWQRQDSPGLGLFHHVNKVRELRADMAGAPVTGIRHTSTPTVLDRAVI